MGKRDSVKAWTCLLSAGRCLAMRRASVMWRRFQGWTERIGFQEKMWCGCAARWRNTRRNMSKQILSAI